MIRLDRTTRKLEIILGGAAATTEPHVTVCFYDVNGQAKTDFSEYMGGTKLSKTTGGTLVSICDAPAQGTVRNITYICVQNLDSGAVTVTVRIDDNGTKYNQYSQSLAQNKSLVYEHGQGWSVV